MAKANPKAWFPSRTLAKIAFRKVDAWARRLASREPFFDTWGEAHAHLVQQANERAARAARSLEQAKRDIIAADKHLAKVKALTDPTTKPPAQGKE